MSEAWRLIELGPPQDPLRNMALDSCLLDEGAAGTLRFYRWSEPALSVGYFQNVEKTVRSHACRERGLWVVRRPTGGGLVRHGSDLTMSFVMPEDHPAVAGGVSDSYRAVHAIILAALRPIFPDLSFSACAGPLKPRSERLCFEEPVACDLEWRGAKVAGSSQRRKNGRLLHQTSILLPADPFEMARRIAIGFENAWRLWLAPAPLRGGEAERVNSVREALAASGEWSFIPERRRAEKTILSA